VARRGAVIEETSAPGQGCAMNDAERTESEYNASLLQDIAAVVLVTVLCSLLAIHFEWTELFFRWSRRWESLELDEIAFVLLVLSGGLTWFSIRRWREARSELRRCLAADSPVPVSDSPARVPPAVERACEEAIERIQRLTEIVRASAGEIADRKQLAERAQDLELHYARSIMTSAEQIDRCARSLRTCVMRGRSSGQGLAAGESAA